MKYREIEVRATSREGISTELMYEIATCRADGSELIKFIFRKSNEQESDLTRRNVASAIKLFKLMKQKGQVQFIATSSSFDNSETEAVFLLNKYPDIFENAPKESEGEVFIFVKL